MKITLSHACGRIQLSVPLTFSSRGQRQWLKKTSGEEGVGISKTTPVSSSIFVSLEPIWVFIISVLFYKEKVTWMKVLGIGMGLGGAVLCIFTQPSDDLASNAPLGNLMCLASSLVYAVYLVFSNRLLKGVGDMTMLKYTFLGAAVMAVVVNTIYGFDAPILKMSLFSTPMLVLLFVLVFPLF